MLNEEQRQIYEIFSKLADKDHQYRPDEWADKAKEIYNKLKD